MMPRINNNSCAIFGCKRSEDNKNVKYYSFPKNKKLSNIWTEKCNRKDKVNPQSAKICSRHFSNLQLKRMLQFELLNIKPPKSFREITDDAIPDQNLKPFRCDVAPTVNPYSKSYASGSSQGSISSGSSRSREARVVRRKILKSLHMKNNTTRVCHNKMNSTGDEFDSTIQYLESLAPLPGTSFGPISCEPVQDIGNVNGNQDRAVMPWTECEETNSADVFAKVHSLGSESTSNLSPSIPIKPKSRVFYPIKLKASTVYAPILSKENPTQIIINVQKPRGAKLLNPSEFCS